MSVFKVLLTRALFMNYASLAITVPPPHTHTHTHSQTFFCLDTTTNLKKVSNCYIFFSLDATTVPTRWTIIEVSHFPIIIKNVLQVGTGTTRWRGQFLTAVGFKAQLLRSTLGPLETIKIALLGNHKTAF